MADKKFMANKRLTISLGLTAGNPFTNPAAPKVGEANNLVNVSEGVRVNGYTFGMQATPMENDRSFADDPAAQIAGFRQFGGEVPVYTPTDYLNTADILVKLFTLVKDQGVGLWVMTRLGKLNSLPYAAGDWVNVYRVLTDGFMHETEGALGRVAMLTFLPQGDVYPLAMIAPDTPVAVTVTGATAGAVGKPFWVKATYQGQDVTNDCTYKVADPTKAIHQHGGMFLALAAGAAAITAEFPGAAVGTATTVTIA